MFPGVNPIEVTGLAITDSLWGQRIGMRVHFGRDRTLGGGKGRCAEETMGGKIGAKIKKGRPVDASAIIQQRLLGT